MIAIALQLWLVLTLGGLLLLALVVAGQALVAGAKRAHAAARSGIHSRTQPAGATRH